MDELQRLVAQLASADAALQAYGGGAIDSVINPEGQMLLLRQAQQALRRSEEAFRGIVEASVDCVITADHDGRITEFNPAAERTFGYTRDEAIGRPVAELIIPPRYREAHVAGWSRYVQTREERMVGRRVEIEAIRADGSEFPVEVTVTRLGTQEPPVFSAFIRDLTDRRLLEQQQRESEQRFRALIENSWEAVSLADIAGRILYCSPAVTRILGYTADEVTARTWLEFVHPGDLAAVTARVEEAVARPKTQIATKQRVRHKDGSWRLIEGVLTNLLGDAAVRAVVNNFHDVTDRTRAAEDLERIFELSPDMICTAGFDGYFKKLNAAFERTLGYTSEELRAVPFLSFVHAADQTRTVATALELSEGAKVVLFENRYRCKDSSYRWLQWSCTPDIDQQLIYAVCRDVTQQRESAAEIGRLRREQELILNSIGDGVLGIDREGRVTFENPAAAHMLGWDAGDILGRPFHETIHHSHADGSIYPREQSPIYATLRDSDFHGALGEVFWRKDGKPLTTEYASSPLRDEAGTLQGAVVTFRDVTERQRSEQQLREREREYRELFNGHPNPMWIYDVETLRFREVNEAAQRHYGFTREEFLRMTLRDIRDPHEIARLESSIESVTAGPSAAGVWRHRTKKGEDILAEIHTAPISFRGARQRLTVAVDVTEREKLHEIARATQASLARAQRVAHLGSWERDLTTDLPLEQTILNWSDETFRIFGHEPGAFVASVQRFLEAVHPEDREILLRACEHSVRTGERMVVEHRILRPDGSERVVREEAEIIVDERTGRAVRAIGTVRDVTDQRLAVQALQQSEQRFRQLANAMPQMVWTATPDGALNYFNQRTYDYFGARHEDLAGWNWQRVLHPDDLEKTGSAWARSLATGEEYEIHFRLRRAATGEFRWHLGRALAVLDANGAVLQWFGTCTDIHDQVRAQEQLAEAQRVARLGSWNRDVRTNAVTWSAELYRIFGLPPDTIATFDSVAKLVHPDDREQFVRDAQRVEADGQRYEAARRFVMEDGSVRMIHLKVEVESGTDGRPVRVYGTAQDVTELHEAQAQVRRQASLLDLAHDAIVVRDKDDRIEYWNHGAERLYGWTAAEALGRRSYEFLYLNSEQFFEAKEALFANGEWSGQRVHVTKSGREVIVSSRWTLLRGDSDAPGSTLVINTDITEQTKLEQQFLRAQRLESIGTLASGVAHDLNNILAPILMSAPLLRENPSPALTAKIISTIEESAERGAQIVKQVLTFARGVEGERIVIEPTHLLKEMVQIAEETFPKSIRISARYSEDVWPVEGDPTQLHQVLLNLSVNARDAMPNGGTLVLSVENFSVDEHYATMMTDAKPGPHVLISATDTGAGMPRGILDKIFDPFFTTKEVGKGTGLGLSTVLGIVKSHGGFVSVYSEPGRGTTFKIFLPAAATALRASKATAAAPAIAGNGETILIVDDEPGITAIAKLILEKNNYRVITAADGPEALALCAQHLGGIDAMITDLMMPFMDGVAVIRAAQKMDPRIRFIASTGQGDQMRASELQAIGVSTCLTKPYNVQKLLTSLHELLR